MISHVVLTIIGTLSSFRQISFSLLDCWILRKYVSKYLTKLYTQVCEIKCNMQHEDILYWSKKNQDNFKMPLLGRHLVH